ncbi:MAG TPA: hypothetical protein PKM25_06440 [Candidatus Ozemobacteraceae bacterium]|nr:hypothetical protein [Candidatus Ozemobacteraceae bacterium]
MDPPRPAPIDVSCVVRAKLGARERPVAEPFDGACESVVLDQVDSHPKNHRFIAWVARILSR